MPEEMCRSLSRHEHNPEAGAEIEIAETPAWFRERMNGILDLYFDPKNFELGVRLYKKFLPFNGDLVNKSPESLKSSLTMTKVLEAAHLPFFAFMAAAAGAAIAASDLEALIQGLC